MNPCTLASRPLSFAAMMRAFTVVEDTREQTPWDLVGVNVVRACLPAGDYSILGYETRVALERKELGDFVACCTHERPRFVRELEKLRGYDFAAVIVEADMADVFGHAYRSHATPQSVIGSVAAFTIDYVPFIFAGSREHAASFALRMLRKYYERQVRAGVAA